MSSVQLTIEDDNIIHGRYEFGRVNSLTMIRAERMEHQVARTGCVVESVSFDIAVEEFEAGRASAPAGASR